MKLSGALTPERSVLLKGGGGLSKEELIKSLVTTLCGSQALKGSGLNAETALKAVLEREAEIPTGVGEGFAFPHARIEGLSCESQMLFAVCPEGVDFGSLDLKPAKFVLLSLVAAQDPNSIIRARAALINAFLAPEAQAKLLACSSSEAVWKEIDASGAEVEKDVLAKDVMRCPAAVGRDGMTLREAVLEMKRAGADVMPVLDKAGKLVGDVTVKELLGMGIPEFFFNLKTVSFVRHMDPFEKYFSVDSKLKLSEMKTLRDMSTLPPDATLMEIVFELTAKGRKLVHVVDGDGKLLGVIDRSYLIDRILLTA